MNKVGKALVRPREDRLEGNKESCRIEAAVVEQRGMKKGTEGKGCGGFRGEETKGSRG